MEEFGKKFIHKALGWYIDPLYRENERLYKKMCSVEMSVERIDALISEVKKENIDTAQAFSESIKSLTAAIERQSSNVEDREAAIVYAYRYLLNREPESLQLIKENERDWRTLRQDIVQSVEYAQSGGGGRIYLAKITI